MYLQIFPIHWRLLIFVAGIGFASCKEEKSSQSAPAPNTTGNSIETFGSQEDFPVCDESTAKKMVFSESDRSLFVCNGTKYLAIGATGAPVGEDDENSGESVLNLDCAGTLPSKPDPSATTGQVAIQIPSDIDPCSVQGFVVGSEKETKLLVTKTGEYFIDNVPPGENDIIITAGTVAIATSLKLTSATVKDRGIRLNSIVTNIGLTTELGKIVLPTLGKIGGKVILNGAITDHAGIRIYVPGTSFDATSDVNGNYLISGVPAGVHNLFFEKDGYGRGQIEGVSVPSNATATVADLVLSLDTGESGTFSFANGVLSQTSKVFVADQELRLNVIPSANAVLMLVRPEWAEGTWQPVNTNLTIPFSIQTIIDHSNETSTYPITALYSPFGLDVVAKFANANGLESDVVTRKVYVDLFSNGDEPFEQEFNVAYDGANKKFALTNIVLPQIAEEFYLTTLSQSNNYTAPIWRNVSTTLGFPVKDHVKNCGEFSFRLTFGAFGRKLMSNSYSNPLFTSTSFYGEITQQTCATFSGATTALANAASGKWEFYHPIWTGTKLLVLGFDDDQNLTFASFNPATNTWASLITTGNTPPVKKNAQLFLVGDKLVVYGGFNPAGNSLYDFKFYDITLNQWLADPAGLPDLTTIQSTVSATNSSLVVFTGVSVAELDLYIQKYDPVSHTFAASYEITTVFNQGRISNAISLGSKILTFSIQNSSYAATAASYLFDPIDDSFVATGDLPSVSGFSASPVIIGAEKVIAGSWIYDIQTKTWANFNPTNFWPAHKKTYFVSGDVLAESSYNSTMTFYSISRGEKQEGKPVYFLEYGNPLIERWDSYIPLVRYNIPGYGFFVWGGESQFYQNSSQVTREATDGAIYKTGFTELFDN